MEFEWQGVRFSIIMMPTYLTPHSHRHQSLCFLGYFPAQVSDVFHPLEFIY